MLVGARVPAHRERLARAGLAVAEDGGVDARQRGVDGVRGGGGVDGLLRRVLEDAVELLLLLRVCLSGCEVRHKCVLVVLRVVC